MKRWEVLTVTPPSFPFIGGAEKEMKGRRKRRACHLWEHISVFVSVTLYDRTR